MTTMTSSIFAEFVGEVVAPDPKWMKRARSHLDNRDFAPEAAIHLTEFQSDITSADDDEMLRQEVDIHHR